ncbi:MAG: acyl-CoA synthetase FdrA [Firmicutes bacterium]|nr:acyl-CoA synthetase FdrA [Bacillota bacterium]
MSVKVVIKKKMYQDSLKLMGISRSLNEMEGVDEAMVAMATETNIDLFRRLGLYTEEAEKASADDIVIAIKSSDEDILKNAIVIAEDELSGKNRPSAGDVKSIPLRTIKSAVRYHPNSNLALISVPGRYAAKEAHNALDSGLNVMIFSDNVSIEDEVELKQKAKEKGLLILGPDCGTSIINDVKLGFANEIKRGPIGIIGASGTGMQEITSIIDRLGSGISHAVGTGGRDLSKEVGGITMLQAFEMLDKDDSTKVIIITSKPPAEEVAKKIIRRAEISDKKIIVNFLGLNVNEIKESSNLSHAYTLEEAAVMAVKAIASPDEVWDAVDLNIKPTLKDKLLKLTENQKLIKGLYTGGTLASEALVLLEKEMTIYSNLNAIGYKDSKSQHLVLDLGDDEFTKGCPHPMIDPEVRNQFILEEAKNPNTAVIMLDVVLGYGSNPDPASVLAPVIKKTDGIIFLAHVCGTESDPQILSRQEAILKEAGAYVYNTNAKMAGTALKINNIINCLK